MKNTGLSEVLLGPVWSLSGPLGGTRTPFSAITIEGRALTKYLKLAKALF